MNASADLCDRNPLVGLFLLFAYIGVISFTSRGGNQPDPLAGYWNGTGSVTGINLDVNDSILLMRRPDSCYGRYRYRFLPQPGKDAVVEAVSAVERHPMTFIFKVTELKSDRLSFDVAGGNADGDAILEMLDGTPHKVITYTFNRQDKSLTK